MENQIDFAAIPHFKYLEASQLKDFLAAAEQMELKQGSTVLQFGHEVPGLYIVTHGEVDVFTEGYASLLAKIQVAGVFGEMSLIEQGVTSSANIIVASPNAEFLLCRRQHFEKLSARYDGFSASFYRGAAEILSKRLRNTNEQINRQVRGAKNLLEDLLGSYKVSDNLNKTRSSLIATGEHITGDLYALLPRLESLAAKSAEQSEEILTIRKTIGDLLSQESYNFDKISQQIELLGRLFANIDRLLRGEQPEAVLGDRLIFDK